MNLGTNLGLDELELLAERDLDREAERDRPRDELLDFSEADRDLDGDLDGDLDRSDPEFFFSLSELSPEDDDDDELAEEDLDDILQDLWGHYLLPEKDRSLASTELEADRSGGKVRR